MRIWLIGGTTESKDVANAIADLNPVITVTTPEARNLYRDDLVVFVGVMDLEASKIFCRQHEITAIIDASHPFAVQVSQNTIAIAQELDIPYLRYDRENLAVTSHDNHLQLASFAELLKKDHLFNQRVLLTVGCKVLPMFKSWQERTVLYARILPKLASVKIALDSGFSSDRIIALRPPISPALEKALLQQWRISLIVTKASGKAGGENTKQQLAQELGIKLITITRPQVDYPQQTNDLQQVRSFLNLVA